MFDKPTSRVAGKFHRRYLLLPLRCVTIYLDAHGMAKYINRGRIIMHNETIAICLSVFFVFLYIPGVFFWQRGIVDRGISLRCLVGKRKTLSRNNYAQSRFFLYDLDRTTACLHRNRYIGQIDCVLCSHTDNNHMVYYKHTVFQLQ